MFTAVCMAEGLSGGRGEGEANLMGRWGSLLLLLALCAALLAPAVQGAERFSDVPAGSWYADTVSAMADRGWLSGYSDGTFQPGRTISAAEFVSVAVRCAGLTPKAAAGHWAAGSLQTALEAGWYDWDEIPPTGEKHDQPISRQLAVKILMRALLPEAQGAYQEQAGKIRDLSELNGRYYDGVFAAYAAGVTEGDDSGYFHPQNALTRAEACALLQRAADRAGVSGVPGGSHVPETPGKPTVPGVPAVQGGTAENGWLQVRGTALCNERGEPVVLRGMSSHGVHWYPQFTAKEAIACTAEYGANLFRVAMYTGEGGYLTNREAVRRRTLAAVDAAISCGMYVIIDWHILSDGNPMGHVGEAKAFFDEVSRRYANEPAVLYEICNEPNGDVSWAGDIKPYAEEVVEAIRRNAPRSVILIGSGTWSQDIHQAAADPVAGENLMYTCHFYAGTHGQWLRDRMDSALAAGLPLFVSEWGTSAADGSGGVFLEEAAAWLDFLEDREISWANWSLCDKNETSAALHPGAPASGGWGERELSESGRFVFARFRGR